jgi:O-acetylserine/cysteine efflux transporter
MPTSHLLLALLVAIIWGVNFIFVKTGLEEISPLLLCALRFILASIPAIFFIKPPNVPFRLVVWYGLIMFVLQFSLFFLGMNSGMTPGMASLIMQVQLFFSMFFASLVLNEKPTAYQVLGALVSFSGIGIVALHFDKDISFLGFILILAAAATWGYGNLITKQSKHINMIALVVWGGFVAAFPFLGLSLWFEGYENMLHTYQSITWKGIISLGYIVYVSTWVGYGVWNWLLSKYTMGTIVPFTLLVPVFGMLSSALFLGESLQSWKLTAGLLVMVGLCINIIGTRWFDSRRIAQA